MTDRELLEKAARLVGEWPSPEPFEHVLRRWNPLADDGDALRLAVKLDIDVFGTDEYRSAETGYGVLSEPVVNADKMAATRRAIVRAAAALEDR